MLPALSNVTTTISIGPSGIFAELKVASHLKFAVVLPEYDSRSPSPSSNSTAPEPPSRSPLWSTTRPYTKSADVLEVESAGSNLIVQSVRFICVIRR